MNIIFLTKNHASQSMNFTSRMVWLISGLGALFLVSILVAGVWMGYALKSQASANNIVIAQEDVDTLKNQSEEYISVLAARVAQLQARMVRIDALGERLTKDADLDDGEFNFKLPPSQGGADEEKWEGVTVDASELEAMVSDLNKKIDDREHQLRILDGFMANQHIATKKEIAIKRVAFNQYLLGLPVKGSITSGYGYRIHPITGRKKMHAGIDIAASYDADIIVPAPGIVTFSGWKGGYGKTIEIDHGNNLVTRYAHNNQNLVDVGEAVTKGDLIGLVGSTGRSTGPHLHFEVIKNSKAVNPRDYLENHKSSL